MDSLIQNLSIQQQEDLVVDRTKTFLQQCSQLKSLPFSVRAQLKRKQKNFIYHSCSNLQLGREKNRQDVCEDCDYNFDADNTVLCMRRKTVRKKTINGRKKGKRVFLEVKCRSCGNEYSKSSSSLPSQISTIEDEAESMNQSDRSQSSFSSSILTPSSPSFFSVISKQDASFRSRTSNSARSTPQNFSSNHKAQRNDRIKKLRKLAEQSTVTSEPSLSSFLASISKI
ncbi:hypothetical protein DdX_07646 [Ditylenchus destructor]|uniref:Uncharacterized protein n=1 Tax=Ditylenchus destructor TaxID=166010 RepID=A0AAD4R8J4_9BILA|nr:hypothetical protein DdX_07646 [Ditylenchus destructor]